MFRIMTAPSCEPTTINWLSGEMQSLVLGTPFGHVYISSSKPGSNTGYHVRTSHTLTIWSWPVETTYLSSVENLAQVTSSRCAFGSVWIICALPALIFQNFMSFMCVVAMIVSDIFKSTLLILTGTVVEVCYPVAMSQFRIVLSLLAEIKLFLL